MNTPDPELSGTQDKTPWASFSLGPYSRIAIRVMQLVNDDAPLNQIIELISADHAFTADLLRIANSALFAHFVQADTVFQALVRIGTKHLQGLCIAIATRAYLSKSLDKPMMQKLWRHSLATGFIGEILAISTNVSKDVAFTGGILHDIGRFALASLHSNAYMTLLKKHHGDSGSILQVEREAFGFDHCEVGRQLVLGWHLPDEFARIAVSHHRTTSTNESWAVTDVVGLSCRMADSIGYPAFDKCDSRPYAELLQLLPIPPERYPFLDAGSLNSAVVNKILAIENL